MASKGLVRPNRGRMIGGVCAAIAQRFGVPVRLVRVLFVVSIVLPGPQVLLYIALWLLLPGE
ncbi:MAG TPA: PspC domain-containing protein [Solirubrobacteraceae bacterium]|nr:PspC domain-containing protein [Solirubrobacteraceae bacterium]